MTILVFSIYIAKLVFSCTTPTIPAKAASTAAARVRFYERETRDTIPQPGDSDTVFTKLDTEAIFPGGDRAWNKYVMKNISAHMDQLQDDGKSGTVELQFIVHKDGTVTDVRALTLPKILLAKIAINMIAKGPHWIPAMFDGQVVSSYRKQKISFYMPGTY